MPDINEKMSDSADEVPDTTGKVPDSADKVPDTTDKMPDTMKTMPNKEVINRSCKKVGLTISGKMVYNRWQKKKILRGGV